MTYEMTSRPDGKLPRLADDPEDDRQTRPRDASGKVCEWWHECPRPLNGQYHSGDFRFPLQRIAEWCQARGMPVPCSKCIAELAAAIPPPGERLL